MGTVCVVAGMREMIHRDGFKFTEYCMLVVKPTNLKDEYSRVGVGLIRSRYVVRQRLDVRVL